MSKSFELIGMQPALPTLSSPQKKWYNDRPILSLVILSLLITGCVFCNIITPKDPGFMDLQNYSTAPCRAFLFGTDPLGRDIFSMIWHGGRVSLCIGIVSTLISSTIAIVFGSLSGVSPKWLDSALMRLAEIILSIPNLLLVVFLQALFKSATVLSMSVVIGITSWASIAKVVRTEVRQIGNSEYVIASKCMGGSFFHILWHHFAPNFTSSIMFMVVMNIRSAIVAESTLSFMGIGLPLETISWGSMLSLADRALMTKAWWMILIPGAFLVCTIMCITNIGNYFRKNKNPNTSNL